MQSFFIFLDVDCHGGHRFLFSMFTVEIFLNYDSLDWNRIQKAAQLATAALLTRVRYVYELALRSMLRAVSLADVSGDLTRATTSSVAVRR